MPGSANIYCPPVWTVVCSSSQKANYVNHFSTETLETAIVYVGRVPWWLRKDMAAVTLGNRIYIREGEYVPNTARGVELLGHELAHVEQYAEGMNVLKYLWESRNGYFRNKYEVEARDKGDAIRVDYCSANPGALGC